MMGEILGEVFALAALDQESTKQRRASRSVSTEHK